MYFLSLNWGKRSVAVKLSDPRGRDIAMALVGSADVVLDNYRPGVMAKLGLAHQSLASANPSLITCSLTGFGETGPYAGRPAYDYTIQAMAGVMSLTGDPGAPPGKAGISYVDHAGGLAAAFAICAALVERASGAPGRHIDLSLLDIQVSMLTYIGAWQMNAGIEPVRTADAAHPSLVPAQNFATRDGYISVFVGNDAMWRRLVKALGDPRLVDKEIYSTNTKRLALREELLSILRAIFAQKDSETWVRCLTAESVSCARVNTIAQALADEQVVARGLIAEAENGAYGKYRHVAGPLGALGTSGAHGAPLVGEDTVGVLRELGYEEATIQQLVADEVILR